MMHDLLKLERPCVGKPLLLALIFLDLLRNVPDKCVDATGHAEVRCCFGCTFKKDCWR